MSQLAPKQKLPALKAAVSPTPVFENIEATPVPIGDLYDILSYRRVANERGELDMIDKYIMPLNPVKDAYGNYFVTIPGPQDTAPVVAFTAHTDSVHYDGHRYSFVEPAKPEPHRPRQSLKVENHILSLAVPDNCLGADDGTGIWVLLNLIKAGVPGLYCFYRDEESGRQGSEWSAKHEPNRYANIAAMLSFDRRGVTDIITHQMGQRCCSEVFAEHIANAIDPGECSPDDGGSFTDSYSFLDLIPECTNVCVGYYAQHTPNEYQDLTWAAYLVNRLITMDWSIVPIGREPGETDNYGHLYSCADIVNSFPDDVGEALEQFYGITSEELLDIIAEINCTTVERVADQIDLDLSTRVEPFGLSLTRDDDYADFPFDDLGDYDHE
ncbi:hypothetical protein [Vreelandella massiliensis]|uniref:hypothetical protein n=1 Tax=Vreelandella massiliensis TaxID=1816686 RepID=UPI00096A6743|nr:hypothetical protein [Halomonas massiliensis]